MRGPESVQYARRPMLLDSRRRRHSSRSSASRRPPRASRDHPELSAIGDMITSLLVADLTVPVTDSSAQGPKETRARDESPCSSRGEFGYGAKLPQPRASAS